jgi:ankyrin repeat/BTB/POZ domain-containing protein 1
MNFFRIFQLTVDNVYETMEASEMLLLPDLKRQCGVFLASYLEPGNVVDLLRTARLFDIPRLEHQCIEFAAKNIEEVRESSKEEMPTSYLE